MSVLMEVTSSSRRATEKEELVEHLAAHALTLAVTPHANGRASAAELVRLAGHDRSVLGHAWLRLVVPALRQPSGPLVAAERLLAAALESQAADDEIGSRLAG